MAKPCTKCGSTTNGFYKRKDGTDGLQRVCKRCTSKRTMLLRSSNPQKYNLIKRRQQLKKLYGISLEQYDRMLNAQNGCCAACGRPDSGTRFTEYLFVDHNHITKKVRGLLCLGCNMALGNLYCDQRGTELIYKLASYLERCSNAK